MAMICCDQIITPFVNQATTTVPYSGSKPTVTVSYLVDGVWQAIGVMSVITYTSSSVTVDHGGLMTGIVKMVQ